MSPKVHSYFEKRVIFMSESSENKLAMKDLLVDYFKKKSEPFFMDSLVDKLIDEGVISESDREVASDALEGLYGDGKIVPKVIPGNTELVTAYQFDVREEIIDYLKQRGARESAGDLIQDLMANRGFDESAIKVSLFDLIDEGELTYDGETEEIVIPRDE